MFFFFLIRQNPPPIKHQFLFLYLLYSFNWLEVSGDNSPDASIVTYLIEKATVHTKGIKECSTLLASIT